MDGVLFALTEYMDAVLEKVKDFADMAHGDQMRRYTPERYIVHPIRVMELCQQYTSSLPMLAAALLHDVLEDTPVTEAELYQFLVSVMDEEEAKQTIKLVVELTDVFTKEAYPRWNRKKRKRNEVLRIEKTSADAQTIKYADIMDNSKEIATHDPKFAPTFLRECKIVLEKIPNGNPELYKKAMETVEFSLQQTPRRFRYKKHWH